MKTNKRGISLIVLIITILVMIILAAAIILNIDDTKIINNAGRAVNQNNMSIAKEVRVTARAEWRIKQDELREEYGSYNSYLKYKIEEAGLEDVIKVTDEDALNFVYTDENDDVAIIPEGFSISKAKGEQLIEYGLVIIDGAGNEFVWVPVNDINMFKRTTTYTGTITDPGYQEPANIIWDIDENRLSLSNDLTGEWKEYTEMYASVQENHGFYIARYEAGKEDTNIVVSKKGVTVWENVAWGTSRIEIGTNGAVYKARQMYKSSKSVVSTLCYGVQWDAALQFIATRGIKDTKYAYESEGKGYHAYIEGEDGFDNISPNEVQVAGSNDNYALNNIYDMAGNVEELTMESDSGGGDDTVARGGRYFEPAVGAGSRAFYVAYGAGFGFRVTLYIK